MQRGEVRALTIAGYLQDEVAAYMGVDPKTLRKHCAEELSHSLMKTLANVAMNVVRCALGAPARFDERNNMIHAEVLPQAWAMCFLLKTRGKKQGWTERVEHTGKDGGPIEFDLTRLNDDELAILEQARGILAKYAPPGAISPGEGQTTH